jgi:hypothetical protein
VIDATQQRWVIGIVGVGALVVGFLELRHVSPNGRFDAGLLLGITLVVGFLAMLARDVCVRRTEGTPKDKPGRADVLVFTLLCLGLAGLSRPELRIAVLGLGSGILAGLSVFIGNDLRRLRAGTDSAASSREDAS